MIPRPIILAGVASGTGKTTVTAALMRAFTTKGMTVAPFKVGPDYIDPKFHAFVTGKPSHNLDSFLLAPETIRALYTRHAQGAAIALIEGVMGLYDGLGSTDEGSTAQVAKILGAAVVLVIDAKGMSRSAAAMVSGYAKFDASISVCGVIFNNVSGERHFAVLKECIEHNTNVPVLGYLPKMKECHLGSRHLGLVPVPELENLSRITDQLATQALCTIDCDALHTLSMHGASQDGIPAVDVIAKNISGKGIHLGVARDRAFHFYYEDSLSLLEELGVTLHEFSPLDDRSLPGEVNALYIGGGFPEVHAKELSENSTLRESIREKALQGMPMYAECGGLMYCTEFLRDLDGRTYPMTGIFRCGTEMTRSLQHFGYVEITLVNGLFHGTVAERSQSVRAHEFHHSRIIDLDDPEARLCYSIRKPGSSSPWQCGLSKNVLAGYPHIHLYSNPSFTHALVAHLRGDTHAA